MLRDGPWRGQPRGCSRGLQCRLWMSSLAYFSLCVIMKGLSALSYRRQRQEASLFVQLRLGPTMAKG